MNYTDLERDIYELLLKETEPVYLYHNVNHTFDVVESIVRIGEHEKLGQTDMLILKTTALLHDIGYLKKYDHNELISVQMSVELLPRYNYLNEHIKKITDIIRMMAQPFKSRGYFASLLCDADLDYLGRNDYFSRSMLLYSEWKQLNIVNNLKEWYNIQITFLSEHEYFSDFSKLQRENLKQEFIKQIKELIL